MANFSLSEHVAPKVEEKFPTHTITFDGDAFPDPIDVTFRNLIALSTDERKRYNAVAAEVQKDLQELVEEAKKLDAAAQEGGKLDSGAADAFEAKIRDMDSFEMKKAIQVKQLEVLATDSEAARAALQKCDAGQVEVVTLLLLGNGEVAGLATGE